MILRPLTREGIIKKAYEKFCLQMTQDAETYERTISWRPNSIRANVFWLPEYKIWCYFDKGIAENRYWCAFGVSNATIDKSLHIACEINMPHKGYDRKIKAVFASDDSGNVFITHSGGIGGGKSGMTRDRFLDYYVGREEVDIVWPDNKVTRNILIGDIEDSGLAAQVAHFVHQANGCKNDLPTPSINTFSSTASKGLSFNPEFEGDKKGYTPKDIIKARCNHGRVINELKRQLDKLSIRASNNQKIDLLLMNSNNDAIALFEAKTDLTTSSIYTGIGQLLLNSTLLKSCEKLVLVIPGKPKSETKKALNNIGIQTLEYKIRSNNKVTFEDLQAILDSINI